MDKIARDTLIVEGYTPFAQVPRWLARHDSLTPSAKALYLVIMTYASNEDKTAFPSRDTLAKDLNVSVSSIVRYMKELESAGAMIVTRRRNKRTGNFYSNHYRLQFDKPLDMQNPSSEPGVTSDTRREVTSDTVTRLTPTITTDTSIAIDSRIDGHPLSPSPYGDGHSLNEQMGINDDLKKYLIDIIVHLYRTEDWYWDEDNHWITLETAFEEYLDLDIGDAIANRGWDVRLKKVMEDHVHIGERYAASVYLGMLHNYVKKEY